MITFREVLKSREKAGQTTLFTALERMHSEALNTWLSQLGEDKQSYTGIPHLQNVEKHIDHLVPAPIKQGFSSTEIFVLLAAVLLHDLGKITIKRYKPKDDKRKDLVKKFHAVYSCLSIQKNWGFLAIPNQSLARHIAIITCAHVWQDPVPLKEIECQVERDGGRMPGDRCQLLCQPGEMPYSEINLLPMADDGPIRLDWLAALLRLGDVVDNCASRVVPPWVILKDPPGVMGSWDQDEIRNWRELIKDIEFDMTGKCIRLLSNDFSVETWSKPPNNGAYWWVQETLADIDGILDHWGHILKGMDLGYERSILDFAVPAPVLVGRHQFTGMEARIEPTLSPAVLQLVREAMLRLHQSVIKSDSFSWDALASESGVNDVPLVRLAARRIQALTLWHRWKKDHAKEYLIFSDLADDYNKIGLNGHQIISSSTSWRLKGNDDSPSPASAKPNSCASIIIPTQIRELDMLLCPEAPDKDLRQEYENRKKDEWPGGIYAPYAFTSSDSTKWISPIIVVEGSSGVGKTLLSLQIACRLALPNDSLGGGQWVCIYYSLEQGPERIAKIIDIFGGFPLENKPKPAQTPNPVLFEQDRWDSLALNKYIWPMLLPRLTPRFPGQDLEGHRNTFEQRYSDLKQSLEWVQSEISAGYRAFFFIDSISAFANNPLTRDEVHRLFHLFRLHEVPLLVTLERQTQWSDDQERVPYNVTRYLADIVIQLERGNDDSGYYKQTIEVAKTRYNRRILGRHLMKLKSPERQPTAPFDTRSGVVIYPGIHYHLSKDRSSVESSHITDIIYNEKENNPLPVGYEQINNYGVASNSCIVISGEHGCHKFALGLNLLLNLDRRPLAKNWVALNDSELSHKAQEEKPFPIPVGTGHRRRLIVSLTEERELDLPNVALLDKIWARWHDPEQLIKLPPQVKDEGGESAKDGEKESSEAKIWEQHYGEIVTKDAGITGNVYITVLNFRMGQIMPEEFLYLFVHYLDQNNRKGCPFDAVLFSNTADLRTRFPFLKADPLFMPTLCDVIKKKGLYSIFLDVGDKEKRNEALLAAADCRIYLEQTGEKEDEKKLVRFYIHNVRGKEYEQGPYYITFPPDQIRRERKLIHFGPEKPKTVPGT